MAKGTEKLITITKIGEKDNKFWIKDESGEFYSGFKQWKGSNNTEWNLLQNGNHGEPFNEGDQALIEYTKTAGTDKEGNDVIYKNLKAVYPADTTPKSERLEKPRISQNNASGEVSKDDVYWDNKAYKQCLWGYFIEIKKGQEITGTDMDNIWSVFKGIEEDAEKRFNPSPLRQAVNKFAPQVTDLPTIQQDEPIPDEEVEGIPW